MSGGVTTKEKVVRFSDEVYPSEPPPLVMANHSAQVDSCERDTVTPTPQPENERVAETSFLD